MKKFEIEIKWGSYFLIVNTITSIFITLLICLAGSLRYLSNAFVTVFVIQFFYYTIKAVKENKNHGLNKGFRTIFIFVRILVVYWVLFILIKMSESSDSAVPVPYIKQEFLELFVEDNSDECNGTTINEFMLALKRRFARA